MNVDTDLAASHMEIIESDNVVSIRMATVFGITSLELSLSCMYTYSE
jgi:hypothetical protein